MGPYRSLRHIGAVTMLRRRRRAGHVRSRACWRCDSPGLGLVNTTASGCGSGYIAPMQPDHCHAGAAGATFADRPPHALSALPGDVRGGGGRGDRPCHRTRRGAAPTGAHGRAGRVAGGRRLHAGQPGELGYVSGVLKHSFDQCFYGASTRRGADPSGPGATPRATWSSRCRGATCTTAWSYSPSWSVTSTGWAIVTCFEGRSPYGSVVMGLLRVAAPGQVTNKVGPAPRRGVGANHEQDVAGEPFDERLPRTLLSTPAPSASVGTMPRMRAPTPRRPAGAEGFGRPNSSVTSWRRNISRHINSMPRPSPPRFNVTPTALWLMAKVEDWVSSSRVAPVVGANFGSSWLAC